MFVAFGFISCEKPPKPEPEPPYDGEYVEYSYGTFYKMYDDNSYHFQFYLAQKGLYSENGELQKNGNEYEISLKLSAATKNNGYYVPQEGEYVVGENLEFGQVIEYYNYQNYKYRLSEFASGKLVVKKIDNGYRIDVDVVDKKGNTHKLRYEGELKTHDTTEPEEGETSTTNFTLNQVIWNYNYGNIQGFGNDFVFFRISDNNSLYCLIDFLLPPGSTSIPTGTYQINQTKATNTVYYCNLTSFLNDYVNWSYDFVSGTVEVTSGGFTINGISAGGTSVTINYTGSLELIKFY